MSARRSAGGLWAAVMCSVRCTSTSMRERDDPGRSIGAFDYDLPDRRPSFLLTICRRGRLIII